MEEPGMMTRGTIAVRGTRRLDPEELI